MVAPPAWRLGRLPVLPAWRVRPCTLAGSGDPETHAPSSFRRRKEILVLSRCRRRRCGPSGVPLCAAGTDLAVSVTAHLDACLWFRAPLCLQDCNQVRRARIRKAPALAVALSAPLCMTAVSVLRLLALLLSCADLYGTRQTAATCATPGGLDLRTMGCGKYLLYLIGMILLKTQCQK